MARITDEQKIEMNVLYLKYKTYAEVARQMGCSPSTVKKYIIPNFVAPDTIKKAIYNPDNLPPLDLIIFQNGIDCCLSDDEKEEIKELWSELVV